MSNNETNFNGYTITMHMRPSWSIGHDMRNPEYVDNQNYHIDPHGYHKNFINLGNTEQEIYEHVFATSIDNYNRRQIRRDRRIENYLTKIMQDGRKGQHKSIKANPERKPFYEQLFYIGNQKLHCSEKLFEKLVMLYIKKVMPKKFTNFISCNANIHGDEFSLDRKTGVKTPSAWHAHNIGIFVAHALTPEELKEEMKYREQCKVLKKKELAEKGISWDEKKWKEQDWRKSMVERWGKSLEKGPELQCSLSGACAEMGFYTRKGRGTAQQQVEEAMREDFMSFCESMGITIDRRKQKHHDHIGREDYIEEKVIEKTKAEIEAEKEILRIARISLENQLDDFSYELENIEGTRKKAEQKMKDATKNFFIAKSQEDQVKKQVLDLEKREKKLQEQSEDLAEKTTEINDREHWLQNGEAANEAKYFELISREKEISKQEREVTAKVLSCNEDRKSLETAQSEFADEVFLARKEMSANRRMVREWEEASSIINAGVDEKSTDQWIDSEAIKLHESKINFSQFLQNLKKGVKGLISKVKKLYDKKIKHYEDTLNGFDFMDPKTNNKLHSFGSSEMQRMFCSDSSPETFHQIAEDMEAAGVSSYDELYNKNPKILERHFKYAREINRTNEIGR